VIIHFIVFVVRLFVLDKSTTSANVEDGPHEVKLPSGWLARDVAAAAARLKPKGGDADERPSNNARHATSPGVTTGASAVEDDLCGRLRVYALAEDIMSSERRDLETAATRILSLSAQLAEARRENDNEWLPIESAPKDGTHLLAIVDGDVRRIAWGKTSHIPIIGFCLADQGAEDFDLCDPTHWRPLPVPPAAIHTGDDDE